MKIQFNKKLIDKGSFEAATVFDVNKDGILDIICGEYWYQGPEFKMKHKICDIKQVQGYYDDFGECGIDVNGDGYIDIVTGGWFGQTLQWRENPGNNEVWKTHDIDKCGCIETLMLYDIDKCGTPEIFTNTPNNPQAYYKLMKDFEGKGIGKFTKHIIDNQRSNHGLGFGDINGNGKIDIILENGWLEQPNDVYAGNWKYHEEFRLGMASVPVLCTDITGNGLTDLIVGNSHGYGLYWWEQKRDEVGKRIWDRHIIDDSGSQYHTMLLVDIDNDGKLELLTGKRYMAHCGNDPGDTHDLHSYTISRSIMENLKNILLTMV